MNLAARSALARELLALETSAAITRALFARGCDRDAGFGPSGDGRIAEDTRFHLSFLAGAVQAGSIGLFQEYIGWACTTLDARGIDRRRLAEHLELLRDHVPGEHASVVRPYLDAGIARVSAPITSTEAAPDDRTPLRTAYTAAALSGDRDRAFEVLERARASGWTLLEVYRELLVAAQRRVGELRASGEISIAQEHTASAITQWALAKLGPSILEAPRGRGRVLVTGVEGEVHAIAAHLVADMLQLQGWDAVYLGTDVPLSVILSAVEDYKPEALGISTSMAFNLPRVVSLVGAARARFPELRVVLGGRALAAAPGLALELGVEQDLVGDLSPFTAT